ncbi:MAG: hypothetical protein A2X25_11230 [Chloroflexi bacterium GWB2_49_20]|nr:MAG: hypothetical protein A2X25_11230 [Chloroflexi bacterium GWB2_49_20]OGN78877.1 MAG: hypothetical protein A2X26_00120 [Chloroflexi bacterium GWC2_49_37]OGN86362.1 MAG: hypothetical protein A2X27_05655 [Chloroflexi bacterium GWD2_49_16]HBG74597.1 hypothetical protein [Anaerolineae bacterium]
MEKKLNLMRFWLFGIFVLVFAGLTAFLYYPAIGNIWLAIKSGWLIWGGTAVMCILLYYVYKGYLNRK